MESLALGAGHSLSAPRTWLSLQRLVRGYGDPGILGEDTTNEPVASTIAGASQSVLIALAGARSLS